MPYTADFAIGFMVFTFWIGTAFFTAGLLRGALDAPDAGNARYLRCPYNNCSPYEVREPKGAN